MLASRIVRSHVHLISLAILATAAPLATAETITLRSGQVGGFPGLPTQLDDTITFGNTVPTGPLSANPFTAADFNATTANQAVLVNPYGAWASSLPFDPQARWIGTGLYNADPFYPNLGLVSSTLYRVPFNVSTTGITSAFISIAWACDDTLGDQAYGGANPFGAYLRDPSGNVTALSAVTGGNYGAQTLAINLNITSAIGTGANELFMYQRDQGSGISGLIFGAEIRVTPAPGSAALLAIGSLTALRRRR